MRWILLRLALLPLLAALTQTLVGADQDEEIPHNEVKNWALKFGVDLWEFGRHFTKMNQIQAKYRDWDFEVARKDGLLLIREMAAEVKNLMDFKMSAVMRIMDTAEAAALSKEGSNGGSPGTGNGNGNGDYLAAARLNVYSGDGRLASDSKHLDLTPSRHYDGIAVNTSVSAVLFPPHVEEQDPEVQNQIRWSEHLDPLFVNNYETDPALSWQYYGSSTGFLRRYPAMSWPPEDGRSHHARDFYDFRSTSWFVEAATSPKDLVILVDDSSQMTGSWRRLARHTAVTILETLGSNDFVNVYRYSEVAKEIHDCYNNILPQATPDNIRELKQALWSSEPAPSGVANLTAALETAFEILYQYNRTGQGSQCNQAVMVISGGGGGGGARSVFRKWNWPHMPVRVFTYLVGGSAADVADMRWMACSNKGFFANVNEHSVIREKVLNYVAVMARPMVMYQADHPVHWSPVYLGGRSSSMADDGRGQLMTSVTMPIFDRRNHTQRVANLLGVVGTDVPIDQIKKLVPPYKLGVNGYSFLVDNNGHVLFHPDLRPLNSNEEYLETLRPLYSNVDLSEVELLENENGPRENHSVLMDLRHDMIDQKEGETEIAVKIHYDGMRRVSTRRQRYFYKAIDGTPFTLGVVLPDKYGMYELQAEQEIKHSPVNVTEYFKGENWRIHPDWVYCEYTSPAAEHEFRSAEQRLLHFLSRAGRPGWKWMSVRPRAHQPHPHQNHQNHQSHHTNHHHSHFNKKHADKDGYYCDKKLVQSLVRDAMVVQSTDLHPSHTNHKQRGYQMFGVSQSFVATRSGLLKWTDHSPQTPADETEAHFSERFLRAFDSAWFRRAVDHHTIEPESFVYSVRAAEGEGGEMPGEGPGSAPPRVMAAHAVFVEHKSHRAPAAVVGLYFELNTLLKHFVNITSACTGSGNCKKTCASDDLDCYILDDSGFVILSEDSEHTGRFFGQIDGTIMESLVQDNIYKKVAVFDYQGRCTDSGDNLSGAAPKPTTGVLGAGTSVFRWAAGYASTWLLPASLNSAVCEAVAQPHPQEDESTYGEYDDEDEDADGVVAVEGGDSTYQVVVEPPVDNRPPVTRPLPPPPPAGPAVAPARPCDTKTDLYQLQAEKLNMSHPLKGKLTNCHASGCERPFSVQKIPHSNLILLVVDTLCPCGRRAAESPPVTPRDSRCRRAHLPVTRRRPNKCINYHPEEIEIQACSAAPRADISPESKKTAVRLIWTLLPLIATYLLTS